MSNASLLMMKLKIPVLHNIC